MQESSDQLVQLFKDPVWGAGRLREVSLFSRFTDDELARVYALGRLVKLRPKANAVIEGESSRGLYMLLAGRVSVYKSDAAGDSMSRLTMLEEGANFGELSLFDHSPRSATVIAESPCFLFQLDADAFGRFLAEAGPDLQVRFYKTCAEELAVRFRQHNGDYVNSQQLLWKYALRRA